MVSRKPYPAELRERAVQMVFELRAETGNARGSIARVGHRLGINTETWRSNQGQPDAGGAGQHMPGIGQQRQRSRRQRAGHLGPRRDPTSPPCESGLTCPGTA
jgi:transposase-like protein